MTELNPDWITLAGLAATLLGAAVTAWAVILKPDDALQIGVTRWASDDPAENKNLPMVQNLLAASKWAKRGLLLIAFGTMLQMAPIVTRLVGNW